MPGDFIPTVHTLLPSKEYAPINHSPTYFSHSILWLRTHLLNSIPSPNLLSQIADLLIPVSWDRFLEERIGYVSSDPSSPHWR